MTPLEKAHQAYESFGQMGDLKTRRLSDAHMEAVLEAFISASSPDSAGLVNDGRLLAEAMRREDGSSAATITRLCDTITALSAQVEQLKDDVNQIANRRDLLAEELEAQVSDLTRQAEAAREHPFWDAVFARFPNWKKTAGDTLAVAQALEVELNAAQADAAQWRERAEKAEKALDYCAVEPWSLPPENNAQHVVAQNTLREIRKADIGPAKEGE